MLSTLVILFLSFLSKNLGAAAKCKYSKDASTCIADIADFKEFRSQNPHFYVDKTSFLKEFMLRDKQSDDTDVIIIIRPPGFGKTMLLSTVDNFLNRKFNNSDRRLFAGLDIMAEDIKAVDFRNNHMNRYPVVKISFAGVNASDFSTFLQKICRLMSYVIKDFSYLLGEEQRLAFGPLIDGTDNYPQNIAYSLRLLCSYIYRHHKISPIVLIDEYDAPLYLSYATNFYREIFQFMGLFLHGTLHKSHVSKVMITGMTMVDFSKRYRYKVPFTHKYTGDFFGFTKDEVVSLLERNGRSDGSFLEENFGGYTFDASEPGHSTLLNPRAVIRYLSTGAMDGIAENKSKALFREVLTKHGLYPTLLTQHLLAGQIPQGQIEDDLNHPEIKEEMCPFLLYMQKLGFASNDFRAPNLGVRKILMELLEECSMAGMLDYYSMTDSFVRGDFKTALPTFRKYLENPGDFFKREFWEDLVEDHPKTLLSYYVGEILYGLELRYNTTAIFVHNKPGLDFIEILPGVNFGVPIRVRMVKSEAPVSKWTKAKDKFSALIKPVPKNETEIFIQYGKSFVDVCFRRFEGFAGFEEGLFSGK